MIQREGAQRAVSQLGRPSGARARGRLVGSLCVVLLVLAAPTPAVGGPAAPSRTTSHPLAYHVSTGAGESDCQAPNQWWPKDQADQPAETGFRVWVCASSADAAKANQDRVLSLASGLWTSMTAPEPGGMGLPLPDTGDDNGDGGKIDIYVLGATQCVDRDDQCHGIDESSEVAAAVPTWPFGVEGRPEASSGFLLLSRGRLQSKSILADLAHEFFHVLQFAHNAPAFTHWYVEASATWAEWEYVRNVTTKETYDFFAKEFQKNNRSLLAYEDPDFVPDAHQYGAWVWPLFQEMHAGMGAPSVFSTWQALEPATTREQFDAIVDESLPAESFFRDFAVTNLQPKPYQPKTSSGLEAETWQTVTGRSDFPRGQHKLTRTVGLTQGKSSKNTTTYGANAVALAAQYDQFAVADGKIHQIKIDIGSLTNVGNADLDVVGRLNPGGGKKWVRLTPTGHEVTLCLDDPTEDINLFFVVISNHAVARTGDGPDSSETVKGSYKITTQRACDLIPTTITGTVHAEETWYDVGAHDTIHGAQGFTIDMTGTFTLDPDAISALEYQFVGDVTYSYEGYQEPDAVYYCSRFWVEPTTLRAEGSIMLFQAGRKLTYTGAGLISIEYGDQGQAIDQEVEMHWECNFDHEPTTMEPVPPNRWLDMSRDQIGPRTADGLHIKGEWTNTAYLGDPDDNITYQWDLVGECPCPPVGFN